MQISEKEVLRYLGVKGGAADKRTSSLIKQMSDELDQIVAPKHVYGFWDCAVGDDFVKTGGIFIKSKNLAGNLRNCRRAALFAASLGAGADALIRKYTVLDMEKAVVLGAVCTDAIESYCDGIEREIKESRNAFGLYLRPRFSPGYGDFDISHQKDIISMLDCGKRIGLTLTDGYMLTPSKSVTALIGLSDINGRRAGESKCDSCDNPQCEARKEN